MKQADRYDAPVPFVFFVQMKDNRNRPFFTVHPRTGHESPEGEYMYNSILSLTSALDE